MAVKNNYWKVLGKTERFYHVDGWEIHIKSDTYMQKGELKTVMREDVPRSCPKGLRKAFKQKLSRDKRIAQSVTNREAYLALWKRIDDENWEFIEENDLKDEGLVHWAYNTRTADEYYRLLRYN